MSDWRQVLERMKVSAGCTEGEKKKDLGREAGLLNFNAVALFGFSFFEW